MNNLVTPVQTLMQLIAEGIPIGKSPRRVVAPGHAQHRHACASTSARRCSSPRTRGRTSSSEGWTWSLRKPWRSSARAASKRGSKIILELEDRGAGGDGQVADQAHPHATCSATPSTPPRAGTELRVELTTLEKVGAGARSGIRVRIIDQGEGIPADNHAAHLHPVFHHQEPRRCAARFRPRSLDLQEGRADSRRQRSSSPAQPK